MDYDSITRLKTFPVKLVVQCMWIDLGPYSPFPPEWSISITEPSAIDNQASSVSRKKKHMKRT